MTGRRIERSTPSRPELGGGMPTVTSKYSIMTHKTGQERKTRKKTVAGDKERKRRMDNYLNR
jgi:hypothetical protein